MSSKRSRGHNEKRDKFNLSLSIDKALGTNNS